MQGQHKGRLTQRLANTYPLWSLTRKDDQSVGFQVLNSLGVNLDDLYKQIYIARDNFYLSTAQVTDLGHYYKASLPGTFDFTRTNDVTELEYEDITVSGYYSNNWYQISLAEDNSIEYFSSLAVPSRITLGDASVDEGVLASGLASTLNIDISQSVLSQSNKLTILMDGGTSYVSIDGARLKRSSLSLEGYSLQSSYVREEFFPLHDGKYITTYPYETISGVNIYGVTDAEETTVAVFANDFNHPPYQSCFYLDFVDTGEDVPSFWSLGNNPTGVGKTLDFVMYVQPLIDMRVDSFVNTYTVFSQDLLDENSNTTSIIDIAVEPHSDRIWAIDLDGTLYCYSSLIPYSSMQSQQGTTDGNFTSIDVSNTIVAKGDSVDINYVFNRSVPQIVQYRIVVEHPSGTKYSLELGSETTYHTDTSSWFIADKVSRELKSQDTLTLSEYGIYTFSIECKYVDGTEQTTKRIVTVAQQTPSAQFDLISLGLTETPAGIDIDWNGVIWILTTAGNKYPISLFYDLMLIDYDKKVLYFRDSYDQIRVI